MRIDKAFWMMLAGGALLAAAVALAAVENRGADMITLQGGSRGDVSFPHHLHQDTLVDCNICHASFPQQSGSIEKMKQEGKLAPKQIMNKLCTRCHRERKAAGEKSGPTTCTQCHHKN
jgi:hypothetical protein